MPRQSITTRLADVCDNYTPTIRGRRATTLSSLISVMKLKHRTNCAYDCKLRIKQAISCRHHQPITARLTEVLYNTHQPSAFIG